MTKNGLNKGNVLHELYHHIVEVNGWSKNERIEEREADQYAYRILRIKA